MYFFAIFPFPLLQKFFPKDALPSQNIPAWHKVPLFSPAGKVRQDELFQEKKTKASAGMMYPTKALNTIN